MALDKKFFEDMEARIPREGPHPVCPLPHRLYARG